MFCTAFADIFAGGAGEHAQSNRQQQVIMLFVVRFQRLTLTQAGFSLVNPFEQRSAVSAGAMRPDRIGGDAFHPLDQLVSLGYALLNGCLIQVQSLG